MKNRSRIVMILSFLCALFLVSNCAKAKTADDVNMLKQTDSSSIVLVNDNLVVTLDYGYDQTARYGRLNRFVTHVYNKTKTFEGIVSLVMINSGQDNIEYSQQATFVGGEKNEIIMNLPMNQYTTSVCYSVKDLRGNTLVEETTPINALNFGNRCVIGLLSDTPEELMYFEYYGNKCTNLDESNLPTDKTGLDSVDMIVVDNYEMDKLSAEQLSAVFDWVKQGGTLIMGTDADSLSNIELLQQYQIITLTKRPNYDLSYNKVKAIGFLDDEMQEAALTRAREYVQSRNDLLLMIEDAKKTNPNAGNTTYLGRTMNSFLDHKQVNKEMQKKQLMEFSITNQFGCITEGEDIVYESAVCQNGRILVYHFSLCQSDKNEAYSVSTDMPYSIFYSGIVNQCIQDASPVMKSKLNTDLNGSSKNYRMENISNNSDRINVPTVMKYALVLILYLIIMGPVVFILLWKIRKQRFVWIVVPILSMIFLLIVYGIGTKTRIYEPYASYMDVEYYQKDSDQIIGKTYATISLPSKRMNVVHLNPSDWIMANYYSYPDYYYPTDNNVDNKRFFDYTFPQTTINCQANDTKIIFNQRPAFQGEEFSMGYHAKQSNELLTDNLCLTESQMSGQITNTLGQPLKGALIYYNGLYVDIGDLDVNETVNIADYQTLYDYNNDVMFYGDNEVSRRRGYYDAMDVPKNKREYSAIGLISDEYLRNSQGALLVAFTEQIAKDSPIYRLAKSKASFGVSAVVIPLDLSLISPKGEFVASIDPYVIGDKSSVWDSEYRYCYMNTVELEYQLPKEDIVSQVLLTDLFRYQSDSMVKKPNIRMYFYNFASERYDLVFDLDSDYSITNLTQPLLGNYIDSSNHMKIKYANQTLDDSIFTLPVISYYKEADYAADK